MSAYEAVLTEAGYVNRLKRRPDVKLALCAWCPPFKRTLRWCHQALGFTPGSGCRQAAMACEPCIAKYGLSYLRDDGAPVVVAHGGRR